ncbi:MAG TPA: DUF6476 family protein [Rhizomicrobium sp.]
MSDTLPANDDPKAAPNYRVMKTIVITLGALIMLAFAVLVWGFVARLNGHDPSEHSSADYFLPVGSHILSVQTTPTGRLYMVVQTPQGQEVDVFDADDGKLIVRIRPQK